jgi:hypothetical protein
MDVVGCIVFLAVVIYTQQTPISGRLGLGIELDVFCGVDGGEVRQITTKR